ncbi:MAG: CPBP family intramembrane metalloprotease [Thioalkalivibrio sp.]|nr:MAG: CPBP family intramembrane metalloprotease [Thioalkalivibrio sp.]
MDLHRFVQHHPLRAGMLFQGALIPLALLLGLLLGIPVLARFEWSLAGVAMGALAALPMLALLALLAASGLRAYRVLEAQVRDFLHTLFRGAPAGSVAALSLLAGFGEEMLLRGVVQGGLAEHLPAAVAILLAAVVFGLAHYISGFYFLFATLIGIYLGVIYHVTGNLLVVSIAHALYDWIVIRIYLRSTR